MSELLHDLVTHNAWADAKHWSALAAHPGALEDQAILERLHHIHLVQHAFLAILQGESPRTSSLADFPGTAVLREHARKGHEKAAGLLRSGTPDWLAQTLVVPWFKEPPIQITREQAFLQASMHSHYHRGQNASRLRELGGKPPLTDLIVWWWKGRPAADWPEGPGAP